MTTALETRMTALDAAAISTAADVKPADVTAALLIWHAAIKEAAGRGLRTLRETRLPAARLAIPAAAWRAALLELVASGFVVNNVTNATGEVVHYVAW